MGLVGWEREKKHVYKVHTIYRVWTGSKEYSSGKLFAGAKAHLDLPCANDINNKGDGYIICYIGLDMPKGTSDSNINDGTSLGTYAVEAGISIAPYPTQPAKNWHWTATLRNNDQLNLKNGFVIDINDPFAQIFMKDRPITFDPDESLSLDLELLVGKQSDLTYRYKDAQGHWQDGLAKPYKWITLNIRQSGTIIGQLTTLLRGHTDSEPNEYRVKFVTEVYHGSGAYKYIDFSNPIAWSNMQVGQLPNNFTNFTPSEFDWLPLRGSTFFYPGRFYKEFVESKADDEVQAKVFVNPTNPSFGEFFKDAQFPNGIQLRTFDIDWIAKDQGQYPSDELQIQLPAAVSL